MNLKKTENSHLDYFLIFFVQEEQKVSHHLFLTQSFSTVVLKQYVT